MRDALVLDLADCSEFRQSLQARPPSIAHGATILMVAILGTALVWLAATRANLVVRAVGRVRPVTMPVKVFNAARGEALSASVGGRVVEVNVHQGDEVKRGDILVRLETERLDNEIAKRRRMIRAGEEELASLAQLEKLSSHQFEAARAKTEAELAQARAGVRLAQEQRDAEVRLARVAVRAEEREEAAVKGLVDRRSAPPVDLIRAAVKTHEAKGKLAKALIPVDESGVEVARRALALAERDYALRREELEQKRGIRRGEAEAARIELAILELERKQAIIRAPLDGIVTTEDIKVGDLLEPGKPVIEIAPRGGFRFEAAVPSEEVGRVRIGLPARIKLDAYDYQRYGTLDGTVDFISPDSGVEKEQKTTIYIVKIAVARNEVGRGAYRGRVKLGMAGQADIVTGQESLLSLLVKRIRQSISLG